MDKLIKDLAKLFAKDLTGSIQFNQPEASKYQIMLVVVQGLKDSFGLSNEEAFNLVFGENKYGLIVETLWKDFSEKNALEESK
tara:strand:- start:1331 stop:1579 length:249 start_codon:yes stop_codon:yes gene_type:complete